MGSTYENDGIDTGDVLFLTVQAATVMKALGNLIACRSWMQARLVLAEAHELMDRIDKTVELGSK